jgi:4-hydroxybenzoate polyprenyltransferase/phosphoserine phosphatase
LNEVHYLTALPTVTICDLDDTLIKTDLLFESVLKMVRTKPLVSLYLPFWLLRGKAYTKERVAAQVKLDPAHLPYREDILRHVRARRDDGTQVVLASASHQSFVHSIANYCQCFDMAHGSSGSVNLKSENKLKWIKENFEKPFEYIGDSAADIPIWSQASRAVLVNPSKKVLKKIQASGIPHQVFTDNHSTLKPMIKQLRVHQWIKNAILAVPLLAPNKIGQLALWQNVLCGIASFSFLASAVYVMNDMLDVENDRRHPTKKNRPFAAGVLPIRYGLLMMLVLGIASVSLGAILGLEFLTVLALYFGVNLAYSTRFKEVVMLDVVILASFYTMRLMAGSAATSTPISHWLLSFSTFFFLGLAMVKRYTELRRVVGKSQNAMYGRGYGAEDKTPVLVMGISSSMLSILILALYFSSDDVQGLYSNPSRLWALAPLLLYWSGRVWLLANRGDVHDDPVVFAVKDPQSWVVLGLAAVLVISAA